MATLQDIQAGLQEASRLATLAKKQYQVDVATGAPQTYTTNQAGEPVIIGTPQARREIPNIQQRIQDKTGMMDQRAQAINEPSAPPTPTADEALRKQIEQQAKTPKELDLEKRQQEAETRQRQREASYDSLISINTTAANAQVAQLKQAWQEQRAAVEQANRLTQAVTQQTGIRTGQARYAPEAQAGMMEQEAQAGLKRLQDLDAKYQSAIAEANSAMNQKNWQVAQQKLESLDNFENTITKELQQQVEGARIYANKIQDRNIILSRERAIVDLARQGITDPLLAYDYLNYDEQGQRIGDITIEEINKVFTRIPTIKQEKKEIKTQVVDIDGKKTLINSETGETIKDLGITKKLLDTRLIETGGRKMLINSDTGEIIKDFGLVKIPEITEIKKIPQYKEFTDAFNSAVLGLPKAQMEQANTTFVGLLQRGETESAKNYIIRVAMAGAGIDQQNQAIGRKQALDTMASIKDLLDKMPTNIVTGTIENIAQRAGISSNPDLAYLGSQIQQQIQVYRRAMTGVAFNPAESVEYGKIFPDISNIGTLNSAKIESLIDSFNRNNRSALSFYIGDENYDKLFGKYEIPSLPSGRVSDKQLKREYEEYLKMPRTETSTSAFELEQNPEGFFTNFLKVFGF